MSDTASFSDLLSLHRELDEVFALHQEALLALELELARDLLTAYRELLDVHMQHEERIVLPLFARAGRVERWPSVLYTGQHEKMRGMLARAAELTQSLIDQPPPNRRRGVIALLDLETTYKHLAEHHDGAERDGLFPICDRVCPPDERKELVRRLCDEWHAAERSRTELLTRARATLGG